MVHENPLHILITGASSGIGEHIALEYAKGGNILFICGRNKKRLEEVKSACEEEGATVYANILDVAQRDQMKSWIEECDTTHPLDIVIANAGISAGMGKKKTEPQAQIQEIIDINVMGVTHTIMPAIPLMQKRKRGSLVVVSSLAGYHGVPGSPAYGASKAAVKSFAESWRVLLRKDNIFVTCVCPGFIKTPLTDVNKFHMPFLMKPQKAARKIIRGIKNKKRMIAFPLIMRFTVWLMSTLPYWISDRLMERTPNK